MDLENKIALGYVRVSTDAQDLERQKKQINDFCEMHKIAKPLIYSEKISGAADVEEREAFSQLLKHNGDDADLVIISEMSRYSRADDLVGVVYSISQLLKRGLGLIFLDDESKVYEPYSTLSMEDSIMLIAKAFANAEERKKIVGRMTMRKLQLIELYPNVILGNHVPYGFKRVDVKNPKKGEPKAFLEINEDEAKVVRRMFEMGAEGKTLKEIQKYFIQHYNKPLENNKRRIAKYGDDLERKSIYVSNIMSNPIYYGVRNYSFSDNDKKIHKTWELPFHIVDKETFDKAAQMRKEHFKTFDKSKLHVNPLKGIIKCTCGDSMVVSNIRGHKVYTCYRSKLASKIEAKKWCGNFGIGQELLMNIVIYDIEHGLEREHQQFEYDEATNQRINELRQQILYKQNEYDKLHSQIIENKRISNNYLKSIGLTDDTDQQKELLRLKALLDSDNKKATNHLASLEEEINSLHEHEHTILQNKRILVENDPNSDEYAAYLKSIISEIVYRGYDVINGLLTIIYKNGFKAYYAVRKATNSRRTHERISARFYPISSDYIRFDERQRVIVTNEHNLSHEIKDIREIAGLVEKGESVVIFEDKIKRFIPRYIINENQ